MISKISSHSCLSIDYYRINKRTMSNTKGLYVVNIESFVKHLGTDA